MNKETAITQYQLGATDVESPYGSVKYELIGYTPEGTPRYRQNVNLDPREQALLDLKRRGLTTLGEAGVAQAGRVADTLATPFDMNAGRARELSDINLKMMDPVWQEREEATRTRLLNSGVREGTPAWDNAWRQFNNERAQAYDQMFLDAYTTTNNAALTERNLPIQELMQLLYGPTGGAPTSEAPKPGVAPVDYTGLVENLYKSQMSGYTGMLGAIGSAAGSAFGGWASGGFKPPSDRRVKSDIELIGIDPRGWGIYLFRYVWERMKRVGYMADEVMMVRPDAVITAPGGFLSIDYKALSDAS